ncbi:hypothetical protein [Chelativorans sp. M5D2P16]|uniref:hypothetical protein n=1 Tax=Chelativorans sp. M5D2P16 TaxID=3095678 RepID=UPI002ACA4FC0|nr:hypothetical protein [Chelativorans sp. M5D2P16]MDZ5698708.1 hypothetical protein [Chelativorans sp. M5D2P16]
MDIDNPPRSLGGCHSSLKPQILLTLLTGPSQVEAALMQGGKVMAGDLENGGGRRRSGWRLAGWGAAALVLLVPLVAKQFTDEVKWDAGDFAFAAALIVSTGVILELAAKLTSNKDYQAAVGIALAAAFLLIWINAAVGIIGSEGNPANLLYGGVLAVVITGAVVARFKPDGMATALLVTALAQAVVGVIALAAGFRATAPSFPEAIVFLTVFFAALWLLSAYLFRKAAREQTSARVAR